MELSVIVPAVILVAVLIRVAAGAIDHGRIRNYVAGRGGRVLSCSWAPFGPGWFGEKSDRIYAVRFIDRDGHLHDSYCKTSLWTGVYFTEDRIARAAYGPDPEADRAEALAAENRRLREELARLKRQQGEA